MTPARRGPGGRPGARPGSGPSRRGAASPAPRSGAAPRPAARTRPAPTGVVEPAAEVGGRRPSLTGRAALLALVLVVLGVSYAYPLRTWIEQRADLAALAAERAELEQRTVDLEAQQQRWEDPAYVRAQARERLGFVLPGETGYVVVDGAGEQEVAVTPDGGDAGLVAPDGAGPWWAQLWGTVETAGRLGTAADPDPAGVPDLSAPATTDGGATEADGTPGPSPTGG